MADLPRSTTRLSETAGAPATGTDLVCVMAAVALNADSVPRFYTNAQTALDNHGYAEGVDYTALHIQETGLPVLFVPMPIVTQGTVGRVNTSGNTGTSVVTVEALTGGARGETDGVFKVDVGGTVGTDQIVGLLSLDGGFTFKTVRVGTATSYTVPYLNIRVNFAAGTLVADDTVITWHSTAPRWDQAGLLAARTALVAQPLLTRTWMIVGDLTAAADATDITTQVNAYETANDRYTVARAQLSDRLPYATLSKTTARMTGAPSLTFAEVGGTGDTITRAAGSWISDGFAVGDVITVTGTASNNVTGPIASLSATVITLGTADLAAEVTAVATVTSTPGITFAEVGASGDTITRSRGSWIDDGFRVGDKPVVTGSASNNITAAQGLSAVTALVLTLGTDDLVAEVIGASAITVVAGQTKSQHVAAHSATYAAIDTQKRIDLGFGRGRKQSPLLGYRFRRPVQWGVSIREYQHDVHIASFRKDLGPLDGWSLVDANNNLVEFDETVDGGALAARFTCFRNWANGPRGTYVALSLTREEDNKLLSRTHNMHVANVACTTVQATAELAVGMDLVLTTPDSNGNAFGTPESIATIENRINSALTVNLLQEKVKGEGVRCSSCRCTVSTDDILNTPGATLTTVTELNLKGTIERVTNVIRVN